MHVLGNNGASKFCRWFFIINALIALQVFHNETCNKIMLEREMEYSIA